MVKMEPLILHHSTVKDFILTKEKEGMKLNGRDEYRHGGKPDWYGTTLKNALERSTKGCNSCADKLRGDIIKVIRKQSNWGIDYAIPNDVIGPYIDPGAFSLGVPECCVFPETHKKHILGDEGIDIILNSVVSCGVSVDVLWQRGIITTTIALLAEKMELSTRIFISYAVEAYGNRLDFLIKLKDYAQPLDLPLVSFWTVSPASSRRIGFALFDCLDAESNSNGHYYPSNTKFKTNRTRQIVIDHGFYRKEMEDAESAVAEALTILRKNKVIE